MRYLIRLVLPVAVLILITGVLPVISVSPNPISQLAQFGDAVSGGSVSQTEGTSLTGSGNFSGQLQTQQTGTGGLGDITGTMGGSLTTDPFYFQVLPLQPTSPIIGGTTLTGSGQTGTTLTGSSGGTQTGSAGLGSITTEPVTASPSQTNTSALLNQWQNQQLLNNVQTLNDFTAPVAAAANETNSGETSSVSSDAGITGGIQIWIPESANLVSISGGGVAAGGSKTLCIEQCNYVANKCYLASNGNADKDAVCASEQEACLKKCDEIVPGSPTAVGGAAVNVGGGVQVILPSEQVLLVKGTEGISFTARAGYVPVIAVPNIVSSPRVVGFTSDLQSGAADVSVQNAGDLLNQIAVKAANDALGRTEVQTSGGAIVVPRTSAINIIGNGVAGVTAEFGKSLTAVFSNIQTFFDNLFGGNDNLLIGIGGGGAGDVCAKMQACNPDAACVTKDGTAGTCQPGTAKKFRASDGQLYDEGRAPAGSTGHIEDVPTCSCGAASSGDGTPPPVVTGKKCPANPTEVSEEILASTEFDKSVTLSKPGAPTCPDGSEAELGDTVCSKVYITTTKTGTITSNMKSPNAQESTSCEQPYTCGKDASGKAIPVTPMPSQEEFLKQIEDAKTGLINEAVAACEAALTSAATAAEASICSEGVCPNDTDKPCECGYKGTFGDVYCNTEGITINDERKTGDSNTGFSAGSVSDNKAGRATSATIRVHGTVAGVGNLEASRTCGDGTKNIEKPAAPAGGGGGGGSSSGGGGGGGGGSNTSLGTVEIPQEPEKTSAIAGILKIPTTIGTFVREEIFGALFNFSFNANTTIEGGACAYVSGPTYQEIQAMIAESTPTWVEGEETIEAKSERIKKQVEQAVKCAETGNFCSAGGGTCSPVAEIVIEQVPCCSDGSCSGTCPKIIGAPYTCKCAGGSNNGASGATGGSSSGDSTGSTSYEPSEFTGPASPTGKTCINLAGTDAEPRLPDDPRTTQRGAVEPTSGYTCGDSTCADGSACTAFNNKQTGAIGCGCLPSQQGAQSAGPSGAPGGSVSGGEGEGGRDTPSPSLGESPAVERPEAGACAVQNEQEVAAATGKIVADLAELEKRGGVTPLERAYVQKLSEQKLKSVVKCATTDSEKCTPTNCKPAVAVSAAGVAGVCSCQGEKPPVPQRAVTSNSNETSLQNKGKCVARGAPDAVDSLWAALELVPYEYRENGAQKAADLESLNAKYNIIQCGENEPNACGAQQCVFYANSAAKAGGTGAVFSFGCSCGEGSSAGAGSPAADGSPAPTSEAPVAPPATVTEAPSAEAPKEPASAPAEPSNGWGDDWQEWWENMCKNPDAPKSLKQLMGCPEDEINPPSVDVTPPTDSSSDAAAGGATTPTEQPTVQTNPTAPEQSSPTVSVCGGRPQAGQCGGTCAGESEKCVIVTDSSANRRWVGDVTCSCQVLSTSVATTLIEPKACPAAATGGEAELKAFNDAQLNPLGAHSDDPPANVVKMIADGKVTCGTPQPSVCGARKCAPQLEVDKPGLCSINGTCTGTTYKATCGCQVAAPTTTSVPTTAPLPPPPPPKPEPVPAPENAAPRACTYKNKIEIIIYTESWCPGCKQLADMLYGKLKDKNKPEDGREGGGAVDKLRSEGVDFTVKSSLPPSGNAEDNEPVTGIPTVLLRRTRVGSPKPECKDQVLQAFRVPNWYSLVPIVLDLNEKTVPVPITTPSRRR